MGLKVQDVQGSNRAVFSNSSSDRFCLLEEVHQVRIQWHKNRNEKNGFIRSWILKKKTGFNEHFGFRKSWRWMVQTIFLFNFWCFFRIPAVHFQGCNLVGGFNPFEKFVLNLDRVPKHGLKNDLAQIEEKNIPKEHLIPCRERIHITSWEKESHHSNVFLGRDMLVPLKVCVSIRWFLTRLYHIIWWYDWWCLGGIRWHTKIKCNETCVHFI